MSVRAEPVPFAATVKVPCTSLDIFAEKQKLARVDFIKCDIEGYELMMLRGAAKLIARYHPLLMLEINEAWTHRAGYKPQDVPVLLAKEGYDMFVLDETGTLAAHEFGFDKEMVERNYIFVHKGRKA